MRTRLPVLAALCALALLPARASASGFAAPIIGPTSAGGISGQSSDTAAGGAGDDEPARLGGRPF